ncbi:MAG: hypothetical protein Q7J65_07495, partial [Candidatus Marinimicrobia bacterium]|nr:hypothetical protein [Candidatus Neomarinimicrobiota bacterium]
NDLYDIYRINSQIRLAFSIKRELQTQSEIIPEKARLLIIDKFTAIEKNDKLYPNISITNQILEYDSTSAGISSMEQKQKEDYERAKQALIKSGLANMINNLNIPQTLPIEIKLKDRTFHYIPYDFHQSEFEKDIIENVLTLDMFRENDLEIYYNGARGLTEFEINCFVKDNKYWKNIGKYTPDFLIITRKDKEIYKALIIETKGEGFAYKPDFVRRKKFVETSFLDQNRAHFGYRKFDFLYLQDSDKLNVNLEKVSTKINTFFKD